MASASLALTDRVPPSIAARARDVLDLAADPDSAGAESPPAGSRPVVRLCLEAGGMIPAQGFSLVVTPDGATASAGDEPGLFYAVGALRQLVRHWGAALPTCRIEDAPDFPVRGFLLDISRDKVPTMETLFGLVGRLADLRINQLQLYTEHTFAYARHREVWKDADPMTPDQVQVLDAHCAEHFIELIPNQNSFGHLRRWLVHPRYRHLAECEGPFPYPWGGQGHGPFSLDPTHPGSIALLEEWYDELLSCFRSRVVNVGCDETFDLGVGRSRALCEQRGKGRVYLDFVLRIHDALARRGAQMMFWGDIILQHPDLVQEVPGDAVVLNWGYEADHPFDRQCPRFAEAGKPFYVCPGTSSWNAIVGRTDNALVNLDQAAEQGLAWGASGYLITDWGDNGHWQPLAVSLPGLAAGAAMAWCRETNRPEDLAARLDAQVFPEKAGGLGRVACDLGNVYRRFSARTVNRNWFHTFLTASAGEPFAPGIREEETAAALEALADAVSKLAVAQPRGDEGERVVRELQHAARLATFGCRRWLAVHAGWPRPGVDELQDVLREFEAVWRMRNRPGGLNDSLARFDALRTFVASG